MTSPRRLLTRVLPVVGLTGALVAGMVSAANASSHREAPLIAEDPVADLTDVYAFRSPDRADSVTLIVNVNPFELPSGGPNYHKFGDDVLYTINVDTNGDALPDVQYRFQFKTTYTNPNTFLYNTGPISSVDDPNLNRRQSYSVTEIDRRTGRRTVLGADLPVAPTNVGVRSTPNYDALAQQAVKDLPGGFKVFTGPRQDPFFGDIGSIFDLAGLRPLNPAHLIPRPAENGRNSFAPYNVHTIALQVPTARLVKTDPVIGVWATTSRRQFRVLDDNTPGKLYSWGEWVQVARLGMPLVNEVVIPVSQKDRFNGDVPSRDGQFATSVLQPELGKLIPVLYPGVTVPSTVSTGLGLGGREDLATIFLTGIPGVNQPMNVKPAEMLRLNTSTASAFPNGRMLSDDVIDTELRAVAGATPFSPQFDVFPNNALTDGVDAPAAAPTASFPYVSGPIAGTDA